MKLIGRAAILAALGQLTTAALAQEGGMVFHLGVEERLSHATNLALDTPAEDDTTRATTFLRFGLTSETRTQKFSLDLGAGLELARRPDVGNDNGVVDPSLRLSYGTEAANSALSLAAFYRRNRVDYLRDLSEFVNDEGEIDLPDDLGDLTGTGWRNRYGADVRLDLGTAAPLGLTLAAGTNATTYSDTTDPDLDDSRRRTLEAIVRARFSDVTEGTLTLGHTLYEADDIEDTRRETDSIELGVSHALSPAMTLTAGLGHAVVDTREFGVITREEGPTARLGLDVEMPNGTFGTDFSLSTDQNGNRMTLTVDRALDLPRGGLIAQVGVTRAEDLDPELIGALDWRHDLPRGQFTARAERKARSSDEDQITTTALILGYDQDLTPVSGVQLGLTYAQIDKTGSNQVDRANLSASYNHELTPDWNMNLGVAWKMRDEQTVGRATSEEVFFSLSRDFNWTR